MQHIIQLDMDLPATQTSKPFTKSWHLTIMMRICTTSIHGRDEMEWNMIIVFQEHGPLGPVTVNVDTRLWHWHFSEKVLVTTETGGNVNEGRSKKPVPRKQPSIHYFLWHRRSHSLVYKGRGITCKCEGAPMIAYLDCNAAKMLICFVGFYYSNLQFTRFFDKHGQI